MDSVVCMVRVIGCSVLLSVSGVPSVSGVLSVSGVQPPEMKHHAFFASFDWAKLFNKVIHRLSSAARAVLC